VIPLLRGKHLLQVNENAESLVQPPPGKNPNQENVSAGLWQAVVFPGCDDEFPFDLIPTQIDLRELRPVG
jgi:hypothetical protein